MRVRILSPQPKKRPALRRALGGTRTHIASQFLGESFLLGAVGGAGLYPALRAANLSPTEALRTT